MLSEVRHVDLASSGLLDMQGCGHTAQVRGGQAPTLATPPSRRSADSPPPRLQAPGDFAWGSEGGQADSASFSSRHKWAPGIHSLIKIEGGSLVLGRDFQRDFLFFYKFTYFWLRWVFVAACRLSLVAASGGYSSLWCAGFSLRWRLFLWSTGSRCAGFSSCGTQAQ